MNFQKRKYIEKFVSSSLKIKRLIEQASAVSIEEKIATMLQVQALEYLKENSNIPVGKLREHLFLSPSSTAQLIDRLISSEWVRGEDDKTDKRITRLSLTKKGENELSKMKKRRIKKMSDFFSFISESDLKEMVRIQENLLNHLEQTNK